MVMTIYRIDGLYHAEDPHAPGFSDCEKDLRTNTETRRIGRDPETNAKLPDPPKEEACRVCFACLFEEKAD